MLLTRGNSDELPGVYLAAQAYLGLGYSVIPVHGDGNRAKAPAVEWKPYQHRRASEDELRAWFVEGRHAALGIVTGSISGLVVLDFDDPALHRRFVSERSELAATRTVQTRRGVHLYFRLPPHLRIASRKANGVDLLSDGRYAVAPPSLNDGYEYKLIRGGQPRLLNTHDIAQIEAFLSGVGAPGTMTPERDEKRNSGPSTGAAGPSESAPRPSLSSGDLAGLYCCLAPQMGRNEALFHASLRARDTGWSLEQTLALLADHHAHQPPVGPHRPESHEQRHREAVATIRSAFSRPPRPAALSEPAQLPNRVREALMQSRMTFAVRVIEGLRLAGIRPGDTFTEAQARALLRSLVGQHSIRAALTSLTQSGVRLFERTPSGLPLAPNDAATIQKRNHIPKCSVMSASKPKLNRQGRPTLVYTMPGNLELATRLNVKLSLTSDPLSLEDLKRAATTRQALHRAYLQRRPGCYPRSWLARRLGVSVSTQQRYNRALGVSVTPTFTAIPISWWTLKAIPEGLEMAGLFLEDEKGKRYPARLGLARKLLKQGRRLALKRQGVNAYAFGTPVASMAGHPLFNIEPSAFVQVQQTRLQELPPQPIFNTELSGPTLLPTTGNSTLRSTACTQPVQLPLLLISGTKLAAGSPSVGEVCTTEQKTGLRQATSTCADPPPTSRRKAASPRPSKCRYTRPLADPAKEALAQQVYTLVNRLSPDRAGRISQAQARKLVEQYGADLVRQALRRLERGKPIRRPAGFLVVFLRSEKNRSAPH